MLYIVRILIVVIASFDLASLLPATRSVIVPSFMAVAGDYKYQWHRVDNEGE
jgi:hypothetical protein